MKPGRNDPCSCGSGKKYKKCCLPGDEAIPSTELLRQNLRRTEDRVMHGVLELMHERYGVFALNYAWKEFGREGTVAEDKEDDPEFLSIFLYWFVFSWIPKREPFGLPKEIPAVEYVGEMEGRGLTVEQADFIKAAITEPFSFFVILGAEPGVSLRLRDILREREVTVLEKSASQTVHMADVIYARVIEVEGASILLGCGPILLPSRVHPTILDMKHSLEKKLGPLTKGVLYAGDGSLRRLYRDLAMDAARPPEIRNTDGDEMAFTTLKYELACSPREAFEALRSLAGDFDDEDLLADAEIGPDGEFLRTEVPWIKRGNRKIKEWDHTTLGHLKIEGRKLTVEVNSRKRAERIRKEIDSRLGGRARWKGELVKSLEKMMEGKEGRPETTREKASRLEGERLAELPEVQARLREMSEKHWKSWPDEKLPVLGGKTPRQAAKTRQGRELLEALFLDFDRRPAGSALLPAPDLGQLRRELGMES